MYLNFYVLFTENKSSFHFLAEGDHILRLSMQMTSTAIISCVLLSKNRRKLTEKRDVSNGERGIRNDGVFSIEGLMFHFESQITLDLHDST